MREQLARIVGRHVAFSRWGTALYYASLNSAFAREHRAVLRGIADYEARLAQQSQRYLLRRNVHMLEKGLSMRPRRSHFALDYIRDTVAAFVALEGQPGRDGTDDRELQWAHDVLAEYFRVVGDHPVVNAAREQFRARPLGRDERSCGPLAPYARDLQRPIPVAYDDLLELSRRRRSVRWFRPDPVPRPLLEKAVEVATLSPSACNRQPFAFHILDDPDDVHAVSQIPMGTQGWSHNIPVFVVIVGDLGAFFDERDRHLIYTDGCLAAMAFVLALETLGLASCCVNWPDIEWRERQMAEALSLKPSERPVMCLAVGFPDESGLVPYSHKKEVASIARFGRRR